MTKFTPQNARELAFVSLERVRKTKAYSNLQVDETLRRHDLSPADRRLVTTIVYGTLQHQLTLEYWLKSLIPGKRLDPWVETLLLTALYQYNYLDRVPDWAVTDETIKIAKRRGNPGIRKFVTGVLHSALRQGTPELSMIKPIAKRLSIEASVPQWLVEKFIEENGEQTTKKILQAINEPAHVSIRVNTKKSNLKAVKQQLLDDGIETTESQVATNALVVTSGNIVNSPLLRDGVITIQDESAMLAVESMDLHPQFKVLDACAAPGGKTVQIAEQLSPAQNGQVVALDIHQHKVRLIERNAQRMGVESVVKPLALDARKINDEFADEEFDRILVDAPCSGIGLLRRKPEIRYTKTAHDSQQLHQIQLAILNAVAPKVKKGGIIIFSTCTILTEENEHTVQEFLQAHPAFTLERTVTKRALKDDRDSATLTILPSDYGSDGFFISCLKRNL